MRDDEYFERDMARTRPAGPQLPALPKDTPNLDADMGTGSAPQCNQRKPPTKRLKVTLLLSFKREDIAQDIPAFQDAISRWIELSPGISVDQCKARWHKKKLLRTEIEPPHYDFRIVDDQLPSEITISSPGYDPTAGPYSHNFPCKDSK